MRDKGKIVPHGGLRRALRPGDPRGRLLDPQRRPAQTLRDRQTARLRLRDPRRRPLPRQLLLPARLGQRRLPPRAAGHPLARLAQGAAGAARALRQTARLRPRHRPDRLGQEHDPGGDDRRDQRREPGPHPHDRGPDRVPAPAQTLDRQPARGRHRRARLRPRPARRPARGPRRDPGRRDARPGDDLHRADRGRDRPPRLRHPAHPVDRADGRPDHRRLPAPAAGPGAHAALDRPAGDRHPAAAADRRRHGAASSPPRCWCRPRRSAT